MLESNMDKARAQALVIVSEEFGSYEGIRMFAEKGATIGADAVEEKPADHLVEPRGDIIEIEVEKDTIVEIGGLPYTFPTGRWMLPLICLVYHSIRVKGKCRLQHFYLNRDEKEALLRGCGPDDQWVQKIGDTYIRYTCGMSAEHIPGKTEASFRYRRTLRGIGIFDFHVESYNHQAVQDLYDQLEDCPNVDESEKPSVLSWLVIGMADPMYFTLTTRDKAGVLDWFRNHLVRGVKVSCEERTENITTEEEKQRQRLEYLAENLDGRRKLVDIGILQPFE